MSRFEFKLPDVGEGLDNGEIVRWHVSPGERVAADQIVADIETDKAIVEIPAPVSGTVTALGGEPGDQLAVGAVLVVFDTDQEMPAPAPAAQGRSVPPRAARATPPAGAARGRPRASPAVRKLAMELGVDLGTLTGSGSRGQITRADVQAAQSVAMQRDAALDSSPGEDRVEPLRGLRRRTAINVAAAWREIPHIYTEREIDASALVFARQRLAAELERDGKRPTFMAFFVMACVRALEAHPRFNASIDMAKEQIVYHPLIDIGFATATPDGLVVPVLHDAGALSLRALAARIAELSDLARSRRASIEQLSGGTFTISNFGAYGEGVGMPIIRPPEVAIAGFGRIRDVVVPVDGTPAVRPVLPVVVSTDHRLNDGAHLGAFLDTLVTCLGGPERLLAHG